MEDELYRFGVKGMKWGVRRYQNEDGSLTSLGKKRDKMLSDRKTAKKHSTTSNMVKAEYARREFEDAKTRLKLENQKKKSKQQPINDKFYSAMKKAGYGAIRDVNDKENSGYFAKNPLIVFDTDKINVEGFTKLGNDHIDSMFAKEQGKIAAHTLANQYGLIGAAFATSIGAMKLVKRSNETKFVENYRKRHPESTLSNNEILKMRDRTVYA